jgi:site-specific recombinase XerD
MEEMTLQEALNEYKNVYVAYRNFADRTRVEYLSDLENFVKFLEKVGINHVKENALPIIQQYVANLEQQGFASLTRKRKVVAVRSFLLFLSQDGYIAENHIF